MSAEKPAKTSKKAKHLVDNDMWNHEEHERFLIAVEIFGRRRHTLISNHLGTKSMSQVFSHS